MRGSTSRNARGKGKPQKQKPLGRYDHHELKALRSNETNCSSHFSPLKPTYTLHIELHNLPAFPKPRTWRKWRWDTGSRRVWRIPARQLADKGAGGTQHFGTGVRRSCFFYYHLVFPLNFLLELTKILVFSGKSHDESPRNQGGVLNCEHIDAGQYNTENRRRKKREV